MKQLVKVNHEVFHDFYEGINGQRRVCCILDKNCIRYTVFENGKKKRTSTFINGQEQTCFDNAAKALNR